MTRKMPIRITPEDLEKAEDLDIVEEEENWNVYKLEDGSQIKLKLVVTGVKRLTTKWQPDGNPIYLVNSRNVLRLGHIPKNLKAKPKPSTFEPV